MTPAFAAVLEENIRVSSAGIIPIAVVAIYRSLLVPFEDSEWLKFTLEVRPPGEAARPITTDWNSNNP